MNMKANFAVMNTTLPEVKIRPDKKIQACTGFESLTSAISVQSVYQLSYQANWELVSMLFISY